jgi:hypothetical protein
MANRLSHGHTDQGGPLLFYTIEKTLRSLDVGLDLAASIQNSLFSVRENEFEKVWRLREFCTPLLLAVQEEDHFSKIDECFASLIPHAFNTSSGPSADVSSRLDHVNISTQTESLIKRLPTFPHRIFAFPMGESNDNGDKMTWDPNKANQLTKRYIVPENIKELEQLSSESSELFSYLRMSQDLMWRSLYVTKYIDTNSVVLSIKISAIGTYPTLEFAKAFLDYIDILSQLVDEFEGMNDTVAFGNKEPYSDPSPSVQALKMALFPEVGEGHQQGRSVIRIFLWTAWQRSVMLYFYYILGVQLEHGYSSIWNSLLTIRGIQRLDELNILDYQGEGTIPYLCNWAFELLRTSRSSHGLDFRSLLHRFNDKFGDLGGRCMRDSASACRGDWPESCQRFTGAETKSQSAHAQTCRRDCSRIKWSEKSYTQCANPRAVLIQEDNSCLRYCQASNRTMAISHVWSHGQGGRPEDGINMCLHLRYSTLAKSFGCESYWIDSTCIPDEKSLRKEAIKGIDEIFSESKVTLVSDQDLQSVALSDSIRSLETILSVLLVCDWNVRAWTMLEATRGSGSVYLLCKDDRVISLNELLRKVHQQGSIGLAILLGSAQHLLPSRDPESARSVEEAGHLLSQRHSSRPGDEVLIWCLMNNISASSSALKLWDAQTEIQTAFLMSSAERIRKLDGYSWAPQVPYIRPLLRSVSLDDGNLQYYSVRYLSYDGQGSFVGQIVNGKLSAKWLAWDMDFDGVSESRDRNTYMVDYPMGNSPDKAKLNLHLGEDGERYENPDGEAGYTILTSLLAAGYNARVIRPLSTNGMYAYRGQVGRGEQYGSVAAICSSSDGLIWKWHGVYQWGESDDHPKWQVCHMVIT